MKTVLRILHDMISTTILGVGIAALAMGPGAASVMAQPSPIYPPVSQLIAGSGITLSPTNGRGTVTVTATATGNTTGSGTSGQVTFWNGTNSLTGESALTYASLGNLTVSTSGKGLALNSGGTITGANGAVTVTTSGATSNITLTTASVAGSGTGVIATNAPIVFTSPSIYGASNQASIGGDGGTNLAINSPSSIGLNIGGTNILSIAATGYTITGTRFIQFGSTASAKIGVSADTTASVLTFTAPSAGSFAWLPSGGSNAMSLTSAGALATAAGITMGGGNLVIPNGSDVRCASNTDRIQLTSTGTILTTNGYFQIAGGDVSTETAGNTFKVKSGSNAKAGTFTLVAGTVTVSNTSVTANSVIACTVKTSSGTLGTGTPEIVINAGVGFTATGIATDASTYNFVIFEVN